MGHYIENVVELAAKFWEIAVKAWRLFSEFREFLEWNELYQFEVRIGTKIKVEFHRCECSLLGTESHKTADSPLRFSGMKKMCGVMCSRHCPQSASPAAKLHVIVSLRKGKKKVTIYFSIMFISHDIRWRLPKCLIHFQYVITMMPVLANHSSMLHFWVESGIHSANHIILYPCVHTWKEIHWQGSSNVTCSWMFGMERWYYKIKMATLALSSGSQIKSGTSRSKCVTFQPKLNAAL